MPTPITLPSSTNPLYQQVLAYLATDTGPQGLLAALGQGALSLYPNYTTSGPSPDRTICPTPFVLVIPGGKRAKDRQLREERIIVEVHDTADAGAARWPGILERLVSLLIQQGWQPVPSGGTRYVGGFTFVEESPPDLHDERFDTNVIQLIVGITCQDRTSGRGYAG